MGMVLTCVWDGEVALTSYDEARMQNVRRRFQYSAGSSIARWCVGARVRGLCLRASHKSNSVAHWSTEEIAFGPCVHASNAIPSASQDVMPQVATASGLTSPCARIGHANYRRNKCDGFGWEGSERIPWVRQAQMLAALDIILDIERQ